MPKIIKLRPVAAEKMQALVDAGMPALLARLLAARGVDAQTFTESHLKHLLPPQWLLQNTAMAKCLADLIARQSKILVVGDYDADGATATAVAIRGLRGMGAQVDFLVPNRFEYGYGLTPEIVQLAYQSRPDAILTVDNGIASVEGVAHANALSMRVLVTDHHLPAEILPQAACIVNPNQRDCEFPSKHLAGVGVMFYVLMALRAELIAQGRMEAEKPYPLAELLDLVALGTVADLVKLDANNRILVEQGLRRIRAGVCCPGIRAILQIAGRDHRKANAQDLGFYVGPRLNAAGRLDDMTLGIRCLLAETVQEAMLYASQLQSLNTERRQIEAEMQQDAWLHLEGITVTDQFTLSLYQPEWHQGVIGILASRIKEQYHRPVIAFASAGDGLLKGSGRSIPGLHLRDALDYVTKQAPSLIIKFGGHAMAAGLTIREADFLAFQNAFEHAVRSFITAEDLQEAMEIDGALSADDMTLETAILLERQVWGQGFPPPLFYDQFSVISQRLLGEKHLKLQLQKDEVRYEAIYFNQSEFLPEQVHAAYQIQINEYNGQQLLQLQLKYAHS